MFLMIVDGMLSAPDQTGLLNRSLEGCQYTVQRKWRAGGSKEAFCAAREGVGRAGGRGKSHETALTRHAGGILLTRMTWRRGEE